MSGERGFARPNDTIFARASGAGRAGVAVWRISGPQARRIGQSLIGRRLAVRRPSLADIRDPASGEAIDRGLALFFAGPRSFTGEDVVEFHLHGSRAVEAAFAEACVPAGAKPAEPGAFVRRAFLAGKMDLAEVEALADLIDAETAAQRRQALGQLGGRLSALAETWRRRLVEILAALEADIDFPDEEDVPAAVAARAGPLIDALAAELGSHLAKAAGGRCLREGVEAAILGAPNAGKSSLLNVLAGTDVAIVSPVAGTTRDVIEVKLDLGGAPLLLADTAGLVGEAADAIEREGVRRALAREEAADFRIWVVDPTGEGQLARTRVRSGDVLVWSKADLGVSAPPAPTGIDAIAVSAKTGEGVPALIALLEARVRDLASSAEGAAFTRLRHADAAVRARDALLRARGGIVGAAELAAEDVRLAGRALQSITGAVDVEDVLGEIFSSFCIGK